MDEVYVEWHSVVFVGVDAGLSDTGRAVCVVVLTQEEDVLVDLVVGTSPPTLTVALRRCSGPSTTTTPCVPFLAQTGIEVDPTAPLFSCIWVNGVQQLPGCTP